MVIALLITVLFVAAFWLVFFRLKLLRFSIGWGIVAGFFLLHLLLVFIVGLRFLTPYTTDATVVQHTIQLVPRLPDPTLVTEVLVEPNVPVKRGQPLFQFDRRPYEYKVREAEAALVQARQSVVELKASLDFAHAQVLKRRSELRYSDEQFASYRKLVKEQAVSEKEFQKWSSLYVVAQASLEEGEATERRIRAKFDSQIDGLNTSIVTAQAELDQARYYLENTTMVAPEDGFVTNLQVRPGMVSGTVRFGAIASFVVDADRYLLATYYQEHLRYVKEGQPVEIALDLYPGWIFRGTVQSIWWASGQGQYLPSGELPTFRPVPVQVPQGQFAVAIHLDQRESMRFPIGAQGAAAIYTTGGGFAVLRRVSIRARTWLNWLYPIPF